MSCHLVSKPTQMDIHTHNRILLLRRNGCIHHCLLCKNLKLKKKKRHWNVIKQFHYLERKAHYLLPVSMGSSFLLELECWLFWREEDRRREPTTNWINLCHRKRTRAELVGERSHHCGYPCSRQTSTAERLIHISEFVRIIEKTLKRGINFELLPVSYFMSPLCSFLALIK